VGAQRITLSCGDLVKYRIIRPNWLCSLGHDHVMEADMGEQPEQAATYVSAHIYDIPNVPYEWAPDTEWKPLRRFFGIGSFGTNLFRVTRAGDVLTEDHTEDPDSGTRHEELYLVVSGSALFTVNGEAFEASAGTFVYVPDPTSARGAIGQEAGTTLLAIGAEPGAVFVPSAWDTDPLPS
jgi:hypothetical protein